MRKHKTRREKPWQSGEPRPGRIDMAVARRSEFDRRRDAVRVAPGQHNLPGRDPTVHFESPGRTRAADVDSEPGPRRPDSGARGVAVDLIAQLLRARGHLARRRSRAARTAVDQDARRRAAGTGNSQGSRRVETGLGVRQERVVHPEREIGHRNPTICLHARRDAKRDRRGLGGRSGANAPERDSNENQQATLRPVHLASRLFFFSRDAGRVPDPSQRAAQAPGGTSAAALNVSRSV